MLSKINEIFEAKLKPSKLDIDSINTDEIMIRSHKDYEVQLVNLNKIYNLVCLNGVPRKNKSYHELIFTENRNYWLFFDVDSDELININKVIDIIKDLLARPIGTQLGEQFKLWTLQCTDNTKSRYHIYTNISMKLG